MRKQLIYVILILGLAILFIPGCVGGLNVIVGSGDVVSRQFDFKNFNAIEASSSIDIHVSAADVYGITVSTHENIFNHLEVTQSGKTLIIRLPNTSFINTDIKAVITLPELTKLNLSGASKGNVDGFLSGNDIIFNVSGASQLNLSNIKTGVTTADISGASRLTGQLNAQNTNLTVSGASRTELSGSTEDISYNVSGASTVLNQDIQSKNTQVKLSGASTAAIGTSTSLSCNVSGASTLEYGGNPTLKTVDITGGSKLKQQ